MHLLESDLESLPLQKLCHLLQIYSSIHTLVVLVELDHVGGRCWWFYRRSRRCHLFGRPEWCARVALGLFGLIITVMLVRLRNTTHSATA